MRTRMRKNQDPSYLLRELRIAFPDPGSSFYSNRKSVFSSVSSVAAAKAQLEAGLGQGGSCTSAGLGVNAAEGLQTLL